MDSNNKIKLHSYNKSFSSKKKSYQKRKPLNEIEYDEKKLYNYAINRLSSRDYSRKELYDKMARFKTEPGDIDKALDKVESLGYLSDSRRARSLLIQYQNKESISKTKNRIIQKGVNKELLNSVIEEMTNSPAEEDKIVSLLEKKFKYYNKDNWDKMVRFLASKGFKYAEISKAIKTFSEIENN